MFSVPIFVLLASVAQYSSAEKYAYVRLKVPVIECIDIPNDGLCPRDHKIPDFTKIPGEDGKLLDSIYNKTFINNTFALLKPILNLVNETCKNSFRSFFCSQVLPDCEDNSDFFSTNGEKTLKSCKKAERDCSGAIAGVLQGIINCTAVITAETRHPKRNLSCQAYPDVKNYSSPCLPRNYKV